jgi:hypothetical protein
MRHNRDEVNVGRELLVIGLFNAAPLARRRVDWIYCLLLTVI